MNIEGCQWTWSISIKDCVCLRSVSYHGNGPVDCGSVVSYTSVHDIWWFQRIGWTCQFWRWYMCACVCECVYSRAHGQSYIVAICCMQQQTIETACYLTVNQHNINTLYSKSERGLVSLAIASSNLGENVGMSSELLYNCKLQKMLMAVVDQFSSSILIWFANLGMLHLQCSFR